jgi:hypothetical protein
MSETPPLSATLENGFGLAPLFVAALKLTGNWLLALLDD